MYDREPLCGAGKGKVWSRAVCVTWGTGGRDLGCVSVRVDGFAGTGRNRQTVVTLGEGCDAGHGRRQEQGDGGSDRKVS